MRSLILSWNPATSFYTAEEYAKDFKSLKTKKSCEGLAVRWPVAEWKKVKVDDDFYLVRCDDNLPSGIVLKGFVLCKPYLAEDPCNKKSNTYFVDVCVEFMTHPTEGPVLPIEELESYIPDVNWRGTYPTTFLTSYQRAKLNGMMASFMHVQTCLWANSPLVYFWDEDVIPVYIADLKKAAHTCAVDIVDDAKDEATINELATLFENGAKWAHKQGKDFFYTGCFGIDFALQDIANKIDEQKVTNPDNEEEYVYSNAFAYGAYWLVRRSYYKSFFEDPMFTSQKGLTPAMFLMSMEFLVQQYAKLKDGTKICFDDLYKRTIKNTRKIQIRSLTSAFVWPQMESMYEPFLKRIQISVKLKADFPKSKDIKQGLPWYIPFIKQTKPISETLNA